MKKNFFKKLSFVMASAMVLSVISPAAGAFAATAPTLNSKSTKYLYLAVEGEDDYDFNINNKKTGWKYKWTSSKAAVAKVNTKGVTTAVGAGTTTIKVAITDKNGKKVKTLSNKVTVRDNIETLEITNLPKDGVLGVSEVVDLNRSYVTVAGNKKGSEAKVAWEVSDKENATIDANGVFSATKPGEYTITVRAFQSSAKRTEWRTDAEKFATHVTAKAETKITVVPSIEAIAQLDATKFEVTFDADMSKTDLKTVAVLNRVVDGKKVSTGLEKIKGITFDASGKVATVELHTTFLAGSDYSFEYGDLVATFKAATKDIKDIKGLVFENFDVNVTTGTGVDLLTKVFGVNADGVKIYTGTEIASYLTFEFKGEQTKGYVGGNTAYIYDDKYVAPINVEYVNHMYNDDTKQYEKVTYTASAVATGVKTDDTVNRASVQYAVVQSATAPATDSKLWGSTISIPAGEGNNVIHARYKLNSDAADAAYTVATPGFFAYTSTNDSKLLVDGTNIFGVAPASVTVIVTDPSNNNAVVGSFDVIVREARAFATAIPNATYITLGNNVSHAEDKTITVEVKDTMGTGFTPSSYSYVALLKPATTTTIPVIVEPAITVTYGTGDDLGKTFVNVAGKTTGAVVTPGAYRYKVTLSGHGTTKDFEFTVNVIDSNSNPTTINKAVRWMVETSDETVDVKNSDVKNVAVNVYGYNTAGFRVDKLTTAQYAVVVQKGNETITGSHVTNTQIGVVTVSGQALQFMANGTYNVTATVVNAGTAISHPTNRVNGAHIGSVRLEVKDTTARDRFIKTGSVVANGTMNVMDLVNAAFEFKFNGNVITDTANIVSVRYSTGASAYVDNAGTAALTAGTSVHVADITYKVTHTGGNYTLHKINVGVSIAVK